MGPSLDTDLLRSHELVRSPGSGASALLRPGRRRSSAAQPSRSTPLAVSAKGTNAWSPGQKSEVGSAGARVDNTFPILCAATGTLCCLRRVATRSAK